MSIAEPSGLFMRWRLCLAEFDFIVMYEKGAQNTQADDLSRLPTMSEALLKSGGEEIPCFNVNMELVKEANHEADSDPHWNQGTYLAQTSDLDSILLSAPSPQPTAGFVPIMTEELVRDQFNDFFCTKIRARFHGGELLPFQ